MAETKTASEELMSGQRHDELIKVAAECIGLINVDVDGNVALAKLAEDNMLNDHEVELVAHAVNNSKQVAHLQSSKPEDKEKTFPLINVDSVKDIKSNQQQPETNADVNTGDRYAPQEEMGDSTAQKQDAPDAIQINKKILKDASISYSEKGDYRRKKEAGDQVAKLREAWGISAAPKAYPTIPENPYRKIAAFDVALDEARTRSADARSKCLGTLAKLADEFRRIDAPAFAAVEKAAAAEGVASQTMDLVYDAAALGKFDEPRADLTKMASDEEIIVNDREYELLQLCVRADTLWKQAADVRTAGTILEGKKKVLAAAAANIEDEGLVPGAQSPVKADIRLDPGELGTEIGEIPTAYTGLTSELIGDVTGVEDEPAPEIKNIESLMPAESRQEMAASSVRSKLEDLMDDEYIGGHSLPEVVEAYNAAMSVNPSFGDAELVSYIRQHLATQGAVPLDLQIRAASAHKKKEEEG